MRTNCSEDKGLIPWVSSERPSISLGIKLVSARRKNLRRRTVTCDINITENPEQSMGCNAVNFRNHILLTRLKTMNTFQKGVPDSPIPKSHRYRILINIWFDLQRRFQEDEISLLEVYGLFLPRMKEMEISFGDWNDYISDLLDRVRREGVEKLRLDNGLIIHLV